MKFEIHDEQTFSMAALEPNSTEVVAQETAAGGRAISVVLC